MASLNKVIITGNLGQDPELRYASNGAPVCNFTVAVKRKMSKNDETDWIPVVAWRKLAEICNEFLHKGKEVTIVGSLQVRTYEDKDGKRQRAFEVVADDMNMHGSAGGSGGGPRQESRGRQSGGRGDSHSGRDQHYGNDDGLNPNDLGIDDVPF